MQNLNQDNSAQYWPAYFETESGASQILVPLVGSQRCFFVERGPRDDLKSHHGYEAPLTFMPGVSSQQLRQHTSQWMGHEGSYATNATQVPPSLPSMQSMQLSSYHPLSSGPLPLCAPMNSLQLLSESRSHRERTLSTISGDSGALKAKLIKEDRIWEAVFAKDGLTVHELDKGIYAKVKDYQCDLCKLFNRTCYLPGWARACWSCARLSARCTAVGAATDSAQVGKEVSDPCEPCRINERRCHLPTGKGLRCQECRWTRNKCVWSPKYAHDRQTSELETGGCTNTQARSRKESTPASCAVEEEEHPRSASPTSHGSPSLDQ